MMPYQPQNFVCSAATPAWWYELWATYLPTAAFKFLVVAKDADTRPPLGGMAVTRAVLPAVESARQHKGATIG